MTVKDINNIPKLLNDLDAILERVAKKVGSHLQAKLTEMIRKQWSGWKPLKPATIRRKMKTKSYMNPDKIWVHTGSLFQLITYTVEGRIPKVVKVGIFNHERGLVAHFLEFGTEHIPERPLFRLIFDLEKEKVEQLIIEEINKELERYLI
jgi:HK97 gp10 family phage protein